MLTIEYRDSFLKAVSKVRDGTTKERIKKQIAKILKDPDIGKPMRYVRRGTRELYVGSYRPAYSHSKNKIVFLDVYHKNGQ
ncbi:type II toxin-antitoxin system RelE/ParE family toxin [Patescibacteria group bacterium]|nr:type II toxin-antitoxin system RelE/ParE family toxin [Patescibacteria group bacterium]